MKPGWTGRSGIRVIAFATILAAILLSVAGPRAMAADKEDAQGIVDKSRVTLSGFMRDKDYEWLHANIKKAKGVLIYPQVLKAGFVFGGSGGTGVLLTRDSQDGGVERPRVLHVGFGELRFADRRGSGGSGLAGDEPERR